MQRWDCGIFYERLYIGVDRACTKVERRRIVAIKAKLDGRREGGNLKCKSRCQFGRSRTPQGFLGGDRRKSLNA